MRQGRNDLPALPGDPSLRQWQAQQEDDLPTLKEVFEAMPAAVAFDIEIKMTTPPHVAQTSAEEVDRVVTAILAAVDAAEADWPTGRSNNNNNNNGGGGDGGRVILYSSFDPEVCLEVRKRCPEACIMFLSDCGEHPYVDDRRNSAGAAIEFAYAAGLQGVILESTVVKSDPVVVRVAGEKGLRVMTYGMLNDDEEWVGVQGQLGVCGVIVDDVERVVKAMR
jgi:glycerophosphodiester phosphodiesterase